MSDLEVYLSLEEFLYGCTKLLCIDDDHYGQYVPITIKPGIKSLNTILVIPQNGKDLRFVIREKAHPTFKRVGVDLRYIAKITSFEAKHGCVLQVPTLENKTKQLSIKCVKSESICKIVHNLGLPYYSNPEKRGNLVVQFEIDDVNIVPPIEHAVNLYLEEILYGCRKRVKITRIILDSNQTKHFKVKTFTLDIEPGKTDKIIFPRLGNQLPGCIPGDVIFNLKVEPHDFFIRNGIDLEYTAKFNLHNVDSQIAIPTLDNKTILLSMENITLESGAIKRFQNYGLPLVDDPEQRGDLLVKFRYSYD